MSGWWILPSQGRVTVDDATLTGIDCSSVPADVYLIRWWGTKGEILYNHDARLPIRDKFTDITPYIDLFNQWMSLAESSPPQPSPPISLSQAQSVKVDIIAALFNSKRQAPFHYPVAAGDYSWDASDATMQASTVPAIQNLNAKVNEIAGKINTAIPALNSAGQSTVGQVNNTVVGGGNTLSNAVNINIVEQVNALVNEINSKIAAPEISIYTEFNSNVANPQAGNVARLSADLQTSGQSAGPDLITCAAPGLDGALTAFASLSGSCSASYLSTNALSVGNYFSDITDTWTVSWAPVANVAGSTQSWVPVGATAPVNVTPTEQAAIIQGIANRTNTLTQTMNLKTNQVNALTSVQDVINYDVTAGW